MNEVERAIETPGDDEAAAGRPENAAGNGANETGAADAQGTGEPGAGDPEHTPKGRRRIPVLLGVAAVAYSLDLVSKLIVVAYLEHRAPIELIGRWLQFEVVRNRGAAFGVGEALTLVLTAIAVVVIVVIARIARKLYSTPWAVALGLLLGGAFGNLTDRLFRSPGVFRGAVVDFIAPEHFAVFNLADSAIVCGGILIVLLSFRGLDPDGTVHKG
ncbi:hypothetical protein N566_18670 [Streptomycetaceae bacterium MP113-05]|nr:hypothetical protein N566_18670 [Streptomycetaceae bacterium MP113-05]